MHIIVSDRNDVTVFEKDVEVTEGERASLEDAFGTGDPARVRDCLDVLDDDRPDPDFREIMAAFDDAGDGAKLEAE